MSQPGTRGKTLQKYTLCWLLSGPSPPIRYGVDPNRTHWVWVRYAGPPEVSMMA